MSAKKFYKKFVKILMELKNLSRKKLNSFVVKENYQWMR